MATSLGGLKALQTIVSSLPPDFPASVLIVMHIGAWPSQLPSILQAESRMPVVHARDGQATERTTVYIAPPDRHMLVQDGTIVLTRGPKKTVPGRPPTRSFPR
jgi:two-component system chemotaxis response regulator CheB